MAIKSIELQNFTVFENFKCDFSSGVNIFVGENGTGKTHLLKALYSFCKCNADIHTDNDSNSGFSTDFFPEIVECFRIDSLHELHSNAVNPHGVGINETITVACGAYNRTETRDRVIREKGPTIVAVTVEDYKEAYEIYFPTNEVIFHEAYCFIVNPKNPISSVYIPAKDMLTHSRGLLTMAKKHSRDMPFDKTLLDIIQNAESWKVNDMPELAKNIVPLLEEVIGGTIIQQGGDFFVVKPSGDKIRFSCEAEGIKKFGLLWQLLMAEVIKENSVLFWDEPEANINPKLLPTIVDILLELSRNGVQIFLATHEYNLMKYFSLKKKDTDNVAFINFHKTENGVVSEIEDDYTLLENNAIVEANIKLLEDDIEGVL